jgi:hypothetical protein
MAQHGDTVAGLKVVVIRRDDTDRSPKSPAARHRNSSSATAFQPHAAAAQAFCHPRRR